MKNQMKKIVCMALAAAMTLSITACGSQPKEADPAPAEKTETADSNTETPAPAADGETYTISIAHNQTPDTGYGVGVAKLKELLAEKEPRIQLEIFDNGVLGNERDVFEGNQLGTVDVAITSIGVVSNFSPLAGVLNLPFMFKDFETVEAAIEGEDIKTAMDQIQTDTGLIALGIYSQGFRHVVSNKGVITSLDDMKGLKIRVPESDLYISTFNALGTSPTPIAWGEMYTAMQTGVVDAFENTPVNVIQYNLNEVSKYETATNHIWDGAIITINPDVWAGLPEDVQKNFQECIRESAAYQRADVNTAAEECIQAVKDSGVEYAEVSSELHDELVKAVSVVYDDFYAKYPEAKELAEALQ